MRYACRKGYHDRCPGRWCPCPCHHQDGQEPDSAAAYEQMRRELLEERAAIEAEAAKLRQLYNALDDDQAGGDAHPDRTTTTTDH